MSSHPSPTICLVDDDPAIRKAIGRLLESEGYKVNAFGEAESFLQHVATESVPVLVSDIWMEGLNAMQLLAHLCSKSPRTRVIFITGHDDAAAEATVMQAGASKFFIKPIEDDQLLAAVRQAFAESMEMEHRLEAPGDTSRET
jgi:FixJ family two-component response regulator